MDCPVELDLFSGRPNPTWVVPRVELLARLKDLMSTNPAPVVATRPDLGYRGVSVEVDGEVIRVFGGVAEFPGRVLEDRDRRLERWLLSSGPGLHLGPGSP